MKKLFTKIFLPILIGVMFVAPIASAANKFIVQQYFKAGSNLMGVYFVPNNSGTLGNEESTSFTISDYASESALQAASSSAIASWANSNGYSGITSSDVFQYTPALAAIARSGSYTDLQGVSSDVMALLSQANLASVKTAMGIVRGDVNFGGTTSQYVRGDGSLATFPSVGSGTVTSVGLSSSDFTISGSPVTTSGSITANLNNSGVSAGTYGAVTVNAKGIVTAGQNPSYANPSRTLNSAYQISSTRAAFVSYAVDISATLTISGGATGTVFLEYADDSGFTTNVVTVNSSANGNTGTLTVGLSLTQTATGTVAGVIPAGKYVRLRTANTTGSPSFTFRSAQEVLW